jgi:type IV secretory pathway VirB4 component
MDVTNDKNIDLTITQILYKMPASEESKEVDKELAKIDMIKETDLKLHGRYSRRLDHQAKDVENFSEQSFDGSHRQMKQLIITRVDGSDKLEVEKNSSHLQTILRSHGVLTQVPYGGQMEALRSSLMSNEINLNMVSKLMSNVAAAMWPGRNPLKQLDTEGILIGYTNTSKNSMMPIYWNPEDPKYNCKHLCFWGGSGKGKSTFFQFIVWNAVGANCDFILFVPKEDMGTSHLDMIKALGGSLIYIGEEGKNFNPFMVFYNPETQGKDIKGFRCKKNINGIY